MKDRTWAEMELERAGITPERVGEAEWELSIREALDNEADREAGRSPRPAAPMRRLQRPLGAGSGLPETLLSATSDEQRRARLRSWQERNRARANPAEIAAAQLAQAAIDATCAVCGGARWLRDPEFRPGAHVTPTHGVSAGEFPGTMPCPVCAVQESAEWLIARSNVPVVLRGLSFADFAALPGKIDALSLIADWWVPLVITGEPGMPSVMLTGAPGMGKTHLLIAAVLACCAGGVRAQFWPWQDVLREMRRRFDAEGDSATDFEARVRAVPVLALDDIGAEHSRSPWATEVLEALIDYRQARALPTLIATNLALLELNQYAGERAASRLRLYRAEDVGGADMRIEIGRRVAEMGR